jgi:hypothetical protein
MKKLITPVIVTVMLLGLSITPAQAIFGLSKCEKLDKQIKLELMTGDILWQSYKVEIKKFDNAWRLLNSEKYDLYWSKVEQTLNSLNLVYESDIKAWGAAAANPGCFESKNNAQIRTVLSIFKKSNSDIQKAIKVKNVLYEWNFYKMYSNRENIKKYLIK